MMFRESAKNASDYCTPKEEDIEFVGEDSFYAFLAKYGEELFPDELFEPLYKEGGRPSVRPKVLMIALLLQGYTKCSDQETKEKAAYDERWRVAMGVKRGCFPFAKSTYQDFRRRLTESGLAEELLARTYELAREKGYAPSRKLKVAMDTTPIHGRGAVKDTYNLIAEGIKNLLRAMAQAEGREVKELADELQMSLYFGSSVKGQAEIDWSDPDARNAFLTRIVSDAELMLYHAKVLTKRPDLSEEKRAMVSEARELLRRLIDQDVEWTDDGCQIKQGVARDRIISVHDPEMRHGRKSQSTRFNGHKAAIAVDTETELITAVDVLPGNAPDNSNALELVEQTERNTGLEVEQAIGDCAYGDGATREKFEDAGVDLVAPVPTSPRGERITKHEFQIDLEHHRVTCPQGHTTTDFRWVSVKTPSGEKVRVKEYQFPSELCAACPLRDRCIQSKTGKGRTVRLHPQERHLQQARAFQKTSAFREAKKRRQVVERKIAHLTHRGVRQAKYMGRSKTRFQLLVAAVVCNLITLKRLFDAAPQAPESLAAAEAACFFVLLLLVLVCFLQSAYQSRRIASWRLFAQKSAYSAPPLLKPTKHNMSYLIVKKQVTFRPFF